MLVVLVEYVTENRPGHSPQGTAKGKSDRASHQLAYHTHRSGSLLVSCRSARKPECALQRPETGNRAPANPGGDYPKQPLLAGATLPMYHFRGSIARPQVPNYRNGHGGS